MELKKTIVRLDKNICERIYSDSIFSEIENKQLLISVLMEICRLAQSSLESNYVVFDIQEFAKKFGYSRAYLSQRSSPFSLNVSTKDKNNDRINLSNNIIHYCIYTLLKNKIILGSYNRYVDLLDNGDEVIKEITTLDSIEILESVVFEEIKRYSNNGVGLSATLGLTVNKRFINSLAYYFTPIEIKQTLKLRKINLTKFYLYLSSIQFILEKEKEYLMKFDYLADLFGFTFNVEPKILKAKINKRFREFIYLTEFPCILEWRKTNNQKYAYTPVLVYIGDSSDQTSIYNNIFFEHFQRLFIKHIIKSNGETIITTIGREENWGILLPYIIDTDILTLSKLFIKAQKLAFLKPMTERLDYDKVSSIFIKIKEFNEKGKLTVEELKKILTYDIKRVKDL